MQPQNIVALAVFLFQVVSPGPIRTGDIPRSLSNKDIADLAQVIGPSNGTPWLVNGDPGQIGGIQYVEAYLPPEVENSQLRRGVLIEASRALSTPPGSWKLGRRLSYAQIALAGRRYDSVGEASGDSDFLRPFRVDGRFDDTELVNLATFIRKSIPSRLCVCPILAVSRPFDDIVDVELRRGVMSWQIARVRWNGQEWTIVALSNGIA